MATFSKHAYSEIAKIVVEAHRRAPARHTLVYNTILADLFQQDNPKFDRARFDAACLSENKAIKAR